MFRDFTNQKRGVNILKLIDSLNIWEIVDCSIDKNIASSLMDDETHYSMLLKLK